MPCVSLWGFGTSSVNSEFGVSHLYMKFCASRVISELVKLILKFCPSPLTSEFGPSHLTLKFNVSPLKFGTTLMLKFGASLITSKLGASRITTCCAQ